MRINIGNVQTSWHYMILQVALGVRSPSIQLFEPIWFTTSHLLKRLIQTSPLRLAADSTANVSLSNLSDELARALQLQGQHTGTTIGGTKNLALVFMLLSWPGEGSNASGSGGTCILPYQ